MEATLNGIVEGLLCIADPAQADDPTFLEMPQKGSRDKVYQFYKPHEKFYFPFVFIRSSVQIPVLKLLRVHRNLQRRLFDPQKRSKAQQISNGQCKDLLVIHKVHYLWVFTLQFEISLISDPDYCVVHSIVLVEKSHELYHGCVRWSFQFDIHHHVGKFPEHIIQLWNFLFLGLNFKPIPKIKYNLIHKARQVQKPKFLNISINPTSPLQMMIMMDNQYFIAGLADIHFNAVADLLYMREGLNGVLGGVSGTSTMGDTKDFVLGQGLLKQRIFQGLSAMEEGWEQEEEEACSYVSESQCCQPLYHDQFLVVKSFIIYPNMIEKNLSNEKKQQLRNFAKNNPKSFTKVYLSVSAAAKMLNHACSGVPQEVMGLLQGFYQEHQKQYAFQITDVIYLPVEASETRVTADMETLILMAGYTEWTTTINTHNIIGWYHSHPSYGCWLSGIDVETTNEFQNMNDPFISLVIDPIKSINFQKLDVGAFRVYSKGYREFNCPSKKDVPRRKALDFGYHYQRYYQLAVELYNDETSKKALNNIEKFQWSSQLSHSPFFSQMDFLKEAVEQQKLDINEYFTFLDENQNVDERRQKKISTFKKTSEYTKERNIALLDTAIKSMLF